MFRMTSLALIASLAVFAGCQKDDGIQTYRVSRDDSPPLLAPRDAKSPAMPPMMGMPSASAPSGDMNAMGSSMGLSAAGNASEIQWKVPKGWMTKPASSMRVGSFLVKGENGRTADVSVIPLSGEAGGDLANINRWRGQIQLEPISEAELDRQSSQTSVGGQSVRVVDFAGAAPAAGGARQHVIAAIYRQGPRTWFFKIMGDDEVVRAAKSDFLTFLHSVQFNPS